ncbi:MAG: hypothetical protein KatS3mg124_2352 [Porticoccaceae bacterium]|nr:MAG: hypothetical protein KatS3mg124_2352 [Porticoccaceae bacterium]
MDLDLLYPLAAAALGLAAGLLLGLRFSASARDRRRLADRLARAEGELAALRQEAARHLQRTAELLGELNRQQRALAEELARGAASLAGAEVGRAVIAQALPGLAPAERDQLLPEEAVEPPRDYAPGDPLLLEEVEEDLFDQRREPRFADPTLPPDAPAPGSGEGR